MIAPPSRNGERAVALGKELGVTVGETTPSYGFGRPAVVGAVGDVAKLLKEYGARWSPRDKALVFPSWSTLEGVLAAVLKEQGGELSP